MEISDAENDKNLSTFYIQSGWISVGRLCPAGTAVSSSGRTGTGRKRYGIIRGRAG